MGLFGREIAHSRGFYQQKNKINTIEHRDTKMLQVALNSTILVLSCRLLNVLDHTVSKFLYENAIHHTTITFQACLFM